MGRMKESISQPSQAPSESADLRKSDGGLSAEVMFQTEQGVQPTLAEALQNPKLKLALSSSEINLKNFEVVKFNVVAEGRFDYERIEWAEDDTDGEEVA